MLFTLGKLLQEPTHPLTLVLCLLVIVFILIGQNRNTLARKLLLASFLILLVPSIPFVSHLLVAPLESHFPTLLSTAYPNADAIVILGGTVVPLVPPRLEPEELHGTRLLAGAKLYKANKAPKIIVSGGLPYQTAAGKMRTEATDMKEILIAMGVKAEDIIEENLSRTTQENARHCKAILDALSAKKVLLVTSGAHLPRAVHWFQRFEIEVIPVSSEHRSTFFNASLVSYLPNANNLMESTLIIKEYLGLAAAYLLPKS